jgi:iron complex outermembrane recepter protein
MAPGNNKELRRVFSRILMSGLCASALPSGAAYAQESGEVKQSELEEVVVTGFRQSLEQALNLKRDAPNVRDSIVAEDIGKMPDLNLAESIQRIPGVAISRDGGEGRNITLRGLGPQFTLVTLNGMEVPSATAGLDSSGGVNRGRSFDFNVFSSELFNRIDVNKSSTASIEEGGLAGTVQLHTARPLDQSGFRATVSGQAYYNDVNEDFNPRVGLTLADTFAGDTFGVLVNATYTERNPFQDGFGTVRWERPTGTGFRNVGSAVVHGTPASVVDVNTPGIDLNDVWFPRLPRQDSFRHEWERLGTALSVEYQPTERFNAGLTWLRSELKQDVAAQNSFAQFRTNAGHGWPAITPVEVWLDESGRYAVAGTFDNVRLRTESRLTEDVSEFNQYVGDFRWDLSDSLRLSGMVGRAENELTNEFFRVNVEARAGSRFSYDFRNNSDVAAIKYGFDVSDPANFALQTNNELLQRNIVNRENTTARLDLEWHDDSTSFKVGLVTNERELDTANYQLNYTEPTTFDGITTVFNYIDVGNHGANTDLNFVALDFDAALAAYNPNGGTLRRGPGIATWTVTEKTYGGYVEANAEAELLGRPLHLNAGMRVVRTETDSSGFGTGEIPINVDNAYTDYLPSANVAWELREDFVVRFGASRTMTRPSQSALAPSRGYSDVNLSVTGGNPLLMPQRSNNVDLSFEWYFAAESAVSLALFRKDIDSLIETSQEEGVLSAADREAVARVYPTQPALLAPGVIWTFNQPLNLDGTDVEGFEIAYQQPFAFLPGFLSNMGLLANYTYVSSETTFEVDGQAITAPLNGLSKDSYNATLYYENDRWGARVSVNDRSDYTTGIPGGNGNLTEATSGLPHYDFSAFYNLTDNIVLTLEVINLTDEAERLFTTGDGDLNLVREYNKTGREFFLGGRVNF